MPMTNNQPATSFLSNSMWGSVDGRSMQGVVDSLTSLKRMRCAEAEPSPIESGTIATDNETRCEQRTDDESDDFSDAREMVRFLEYRGFDDEIISTSCGLPAEVALLEDDNDDSNSDQDSESELDASECGEESNDEDDGEEDDEDVVEEENEYKENFQTDEDKDDDGPDVQYETDQYSVESGRSEGDEDDEKSMADAFVRSEVIGDSLCHVSRGSEAQQRHELFLPRNISPSIESLKYEEDDSSSDDDDDGPHCCYRTYMIKRGGRPRMWDGSPAGISVSSNSSSSEDGSHLSRLTTKRKKACKKAGVSFSNSVTVYPVFHSKTYPSSIVKGMYTKRKELRVIKLRNLREFAYDSQDWQNATEEKDFETDDKGELVHPVHCTKETTNAVKNYPLAPRGYQVESTNGPGVARRSKRMKMHYP